MHSELQSHNVSCRRSLHEEFTKSEAQNLEYQEAQLRVQLQTEELMMTFLKGRLQETSESERQAVISAQQQAIALQSGIWQAMTAFGCWETEVMRLTRGVGEQSRRAGGTPHGSPVPLPPSGIDYSQPFTPKS